MRTRLLSPSEFIAATALLMVALWLERLFAALCAVQYRKQFTITLHVSWLSLAQRTKGSSRPRMAVTHMRDRGVRRCVGNSHRCRRTRALLKCGCLLLKCRRLGLDRFDSAHDCVHVPSNLNTVGMREFQHGPQTVSMGGEDSAHSPQVRSDPRSTELASGQHSP